MPIFDLGGRKRYPSRQAKPAFGLLPNVACEEVNVATQPCDAIVFVSNGILDDVTRFQGAQDRFDDETIIVLRVR
jgi:hypothetical protein